jgi:hypothetical protein
LDPREIASGFLRQLTAGGIKGFDLFKEKGKDKYSLLITQRAKNTPSFYGWIPHNASFGFLEIAGPTLGQIHFLDRF